MYLISSCLVGVNCRYDGSSALYPKLKQLVNEGKAIMLCPEILAGLPTPRETCEIVNEDGEPKVLSKSGIDYSEAFEKAALKTLKICKEKGVDKAILQSRSPSCGFGKIYDGTFEGNLIPGNGLTADLLCKNGVEVSNDEDWH